MATGHDGGRSLKKSKSSWLLAPACWNWDPDRELTGKSLMAGIKYVVQICHLNSWSICEPYSEGEFDNLTLPLCIYRSFDAIYSNKVLHHLEDEHWRFHQATHEILNPGGVVCHTFWKGKIQKPTRAFLSTTIQIWPYSLFGELFQYFSCALQGV